MLLALYVLFAIVALLAPFVTVVTIDTRGLWSDVWLFTGPIGFGLALLLAAASINIEAVSNGVTLQFANEYLVVLWLGLAGFNVLYLVYGPIAKLREALEAGPSESPMAVGEQVGAAETGRETRGTIMQSFRDGRSGGGSWTPDDDRDRSRRRDTDRR